MIILKMAKRCKSCDTILQIELLISDKLGSDLNLCVSCIMAAVREILKEEKRRASTAMSELLSSSATTTAATSIEQ